MKHICTKKNSSDVNILVKTAGIDEKLLSLKSYIGDNEEIQILLTKERSTT